MVKEYQQARKLIEKCLIWSQFKQALKMFNLTRDQLIGIEREWRAFWYLKSRLGLYNFRISTPFEDSQGTDIVGENNGKWITYQVGGSKVKECFTDYYVQVTEKKVYLRKGVSND